MKPLTLAKTRRAAEHSSFQRFSFQRFSFTQFPLFPRNPLFPALQSSPRLLPAGRSSPTAVQEPPAKSKFLAVPARGRFLVLALALVCAAGSAFAFPPAPPFTIHGIARDSYGWALKATDAGTVVIRRNGAIIAEAPLDETARSGENFRALVAMDTNPADPYRTGAQTTGALFSIEVRFPTVTMPVASLTADRRTIGQPAGSLFIDFSVGVDSDGDGIPDSWEWWQLSEFGIGPGDPRWSLATLGRGDFDGDGTSDYVEYLAGTFAFLTEDNFGLAIDGFAPDGSAQLHALLVVDKVYRVESSLDLQTWATTSVRVGNSAAALATTFSTADTHEVPIYAPLSGDRSQRFYRLVLVR